MRTRYHILTTLAKSMAAACVCAALALCTCTGYAADAPLALPVRESPLETGAWDYYAIREDGSLIMWGRPESGGIERDIPFDQALVLLDNAAAVYNARGDILALDRDGTLWSSNLYRFTGSEQNWDHLTLYKVMDDVSMADINQFHSVILKRDGTVWVQCIGAWGAPWLRQFGPHLVEVMDNAIWVGTTAYGAYAVTADHELWGWGLTHDSTTGPEKLLDDVCQAYGNKVLMLDGRLMRWTSGPDGKLDGEPELLLSGVTHCGWDYAVTADGGLWMNDVTYGWTTEDSFVKVMEGVVYATRGLWGGPSVLALEADGSLWQLIPDEDSGEIIRTRLSGGFHVPEKFLGLQNFLDVKQYSEGIFPDVGAGDWFQPNVKAAYELGLMQGRGDTFNPTGEIRLSEAITIAARVRSIYMGDRADFSAAGPWYQPYVDYALAHGILDTASIDLDRPATRAELASLLAAALPEQALKPVNDGIDFVDMDESHPGYTAAQTMAKAGIMQGRDNRCFAPDATLMRCEAAAVLSRCARPGLRLGAK